MQDALKEITRELDATEQRRERILKESRDVVSLASRSIVGIHTGKLRTAKAELNSAEKLLAELRKLGGEDLQRYLITPESEFVEASVLLAVSSHQAIPSRNQLRVHGVPYLMGLLDAVGELKRLVFDQIRKGAVSKASELFGLMEHLYVNLLPFAVYDHVAQGVRRKLDVARILIEDTRSAVTEESRRIEFMRAMDRLSHKLPPKVRK